MPITNGMRYAIKAAIARLKADAQLNTALELNERVYRDGAPQGPTYPLCLVSPYTDVDLNTQGFIHVWGELQILVKFVDRFEGRAMSRAAIDDMAERAAVLLHEYSTTQDGVYLTKFRRTASPPQGPTDTGTGIRYAYANQIFDVEAQAA